MARIILHASYYALYPQSYNQPSISPRSKHLPTLSFLFSVFNSPIMQHFLSQGRLLWLSLPAVAMAIQIITPGSTPAGGASSPRGGSLNLVSPTILNNINDRPHPECKDPDDPYPFINSLNRTLPPTPPLPSPDYPPGESQIFAFDCYLEIVHGWLGVEVCRMRRLLWRWT